VIADGPPLDPSADEARSWLREELARSVYSDRPGWVQRAFRWLADKIGELLHGTGSMGAAGSLLRFVVFLVVLGLVALVVVGLLRGFRPGGRIRGRAHGGRGVLDGDDRSAAEHRADAAAALAAGRWNAAVVAGFRAIARAAIERTVLDDSPGRTADEVAEQLGPAFAAHRSDLRRASRIFDDVFYGDLSADEAAARHVVATDAALAAARPDFAAASTVTVHEPVR
jgi:hypothetical protein